MKIHITNTYNIQGTPKLAQNKLANIARELGFHEMGIFKYPTDVDNDRELSSRLDGIIASLNYGDIVFIQSPNWNGTRYNLHFIRKLKAYRDVKIAIFVHDIVTLLNAGNHSGEQLHEIIEFYNYADLIIVPSRKMQEYLQQHGLTVKKQMVQEFFDYPISVGLNEPYFKKQLFFTGAPSRFPFLQEWRYQTPLIMYTAERFSMDGLNIKVRGYRKEAQLLVELSEGGYGLVWSSEEANSYYRMVQPYKVSNFLAAGIPVILQKGLAPEPMILNNGLGFVAESLEEVDAIIQSVTEEQYMKMVHRISEFNFLIKNGWFTKKMLSEAVVWLLNDNYNI